MVEPVRVGVIIVSFNTVALLRGALASVARAAEAAEGLLLLQTIVVDNASSDGSAEMVAADFPAVTLVRAETNLGFTVANNLALTRFGLVVGDRAAQHVRLEQPDYVLLLNPDAEIVGDALQLLVDFMAGVPSAGVVGPRLVYSDGTFQHGAFTFPGVMQVALDLFPFGRLPGAHRLYSGRANGRYPQALWEGGKPFVVDFVLGAAMLVRSDMVRAVGGLDEGFFMYCEEMDWQLRAHEAGWEVYALPAAQVLHHEAQSSRQIRWQSWQRLWTSRLRFYTLHADAFASGSVALIRSMVRWTQWRAIRRARRDFAAGNLTGEQAGAEVAARSAVLQLAKGLPLA